MSPAEPKEQFQAFNWTHNAILPFWYANRLCQTTLAASAAAHPALPLLISGALVCLQGVLNQGSATHQAARQKAVARIFDPSQFHELDSDFPPITPETRSYPVRLHYRNIRGSKNIPVVGNCLPSVTTTSHWCLQVGEQFIELRQRQESSQILHSAGSKKRSWNGKAIRLVISEEREVFEDVAERDCGATQLRPEQVEARACKIFQDYFADGYDMMLDNCQYFATLLCMSIVPQEDMTRVRRLLEKNSTIILGTGASILISPLRVWSELCFKQISVNGMTSKEPESLTGLDRWVYEKNAKIDAVYAHPALMMARQRASERIENEISKHYSELVEKVNANPHFESAANWCNGEAERLRTLYNSPEAAVSREKVKNKWKETCARSEMAWNKTKAWSQSKVASGKEKRTAETSISLDSEEPDGADQWGLSAEIERLLSVTKESGSFDQSSLSRYGSASSFVEGEAPTYVIALFDCAAQEEGELSFAWGDRIQVHEVTNSDDDWWLGTLRGNTGRFRANQVDYAELFS